MTKIEVNQKHKASDPTHSTTSGKIRNIWLIVLVIAVGVATIIILVRLSGSKSQANQPALKTNLEIPSYIQNSQDPIALLKGARQSIEQGDLSLAYMALGRSIELSPIYRDSWLHLGVVLLEMYKRGEAPPLQPHIPHNPPVDSLLDRAELALRYARSRDPIYDPTLKKLAEVYTLQGNTQAADTVKQTIDELKKIDRGQ